ncbi:MAG: glycine cleavage system aminomethyltransferase GcvT, partial [Planctomycetota bacterium]
MTTPLLETPLTAWHAAHGGRMVDFAGWTMPVQYASIVEEHLATRRAAGLFDVSHMGRLTVTGPDAVAWLDSLLTRRVADLAPGQVRYTLVTSDEGPTGVSILDDALVAREADAADGSPRLSLVVNASNRDRVVAWLRSRLPAAGVTLTDHTRDTAMIAVQGPQAVELVAGLCPVADAARLTALKNYRATTATVAGRPAAVSRTGYTGEDGVELVVAAADAVAAWEAILAAGASHGVVPCGLGARDTLRLEAGMPLYGHELLPTSDPFALGLAFAVNLTAADGSPREFPGAAGLRGMQSEPGGRIRVGLVCEGKRAAREGSLVTRPGDPASVVGSVTSGSYCPTLGTAAAMALVDRDAAAEGTPLAVVIRDSATAARVTPLPLYRRPASRS